MKMFLLIAIAFALEPATELEETRDTEEKNMGAGAICLINFGDERGKAVEVKNEVEDKSGIKKYVVRRVDAPNSNKTIMLSRDNLSLTELDTDMDNWNAKALALEADIANGIVELINRDDKASNDGDVTALIDFLASQPIDCDLLQCSQFERYLHDADN
jgi:hypothetical protein